MAVGGGSFRMIYTHGRDAGAFIFMGFGILVMLVGAILMAVGTGMGVKRAFRNDAKQPLRQDPNVMIVSKFALGPTGDLVVELDIFEPHEMTYYVRLLLSDGKPAELKCSRTLWETVADGGRGCASFQGDWLGSYEPHARPTVEAPPDPFVTGNF
jgi:hypothetical protein